MINAKINNLKIIYLSFVLKYYNTLNIFQIIFLQRIEYPRILKELIPLQKYSQKYQLIYLE